MTGIDGWSKQHDSLLADAHKILESDDQGSAKRIMLGAFCRKVRGLCTTNTPVAVRAKFKDVATVIANYSDGHIPADHPCHIRRLVNKLQYDDLKIIQQSIEGAITDRAAPDGAW